MNRKELLDKVASQGEEFLKTGAKNLQNEIKLGFAQLAERSPEFGEVYSAIGSPFVSAHLIRQFDGAYNGDVFVWDIDKTYLQTHFSSLRGLAAIPFESAEDKLAVPGTVPLILALRKGINDQEDAAHPLFFVSGSPPQLRQVIQEKMTLDGIQFDGLMFKDQWGLVRAGRPKDVKKQIGYKLAALLTLKLHIQGSPKFYCFGDDVESDAEVFTLYSQVMKGLSKEELRERLKKAQVHEHDIGFIFSVLEEPSMLQSIEDYKYKDPVGQIFIHLDRRTKPDILKSDLVMPSYNFIQSTMILANMGLIPEASIALVAQDLRKNKVSEFALAIYVHDASNRFDLPNHYANLIFGK
jgi:hypothetical protein